MTLENTIRLFAGTFVLASLSLGYWVHNGWFLVTAFVGLNLIQSSFTKWCLAESILKQLVFKTVNITDQGKETVE
ncbi:MAG: DUF2892 domain-containing protein [Candidatus Latescibacteria bacterium]|nr:DUF2892 domain-containing protein [Candidatus Latescibacterota bacterium]